MMAMPINGEIDSAEARGKRVRYVRDQLLGMSRETFCKGSNISHPSLKAWELGWGGGLTKTGARKFSDATKTYGYYCGVPWLLYGIGTAPIILSSTLQQLENQEEQIAKELLLFRSNPNSIDTVAIDDAMSPAIKPNDYVGGITVGNFDEALGKECLIKDLNGNEYIRVLHKGERANQYHLLCYNKQSPHASDIHNVQLQSVAPIIWIRRLQQ